MENQKPADQNILSSIPSFAKGTENTEQFTRLHGWNSYSQTLSDTCEGSTKKRKGRSIFSEAQIQLLEGRFQQQKYLGTDERMELAKILNMTEVQVKTWFQNRRMKLKRKRAEAAEKFTKMMLLNNLATTVSTAPSPMASYHGYRPSLPSQNLPPGMSASYRNMFPSAQPRQMVPRDNIPPSPQQNFAFRLPTQLSPAREMINARPMPPTSKNLHELRPAKPRVYLPPWNVVPSSTAALPSFCDTALNSLRLMQEVKTELD